VVQLESTIMGIASPSREKGPFSSILVRRDRSFWLMLQLLVAWLAIGGECAPRACSTWTSVGNGDSAFRSLWQGRDASFSLLNSEDKDLVGSCHDGSFCFGWLHGTWAQLANRGRGHPCQDLPV
jgi:hypothetical protein